MRLILLLFVLSSAFVSCKKQEDGVYKNLKYGSDARNKMDVYLPEQRDSTTAVVLLIHGGGWVAGNKEDWGKDTRDFLLDAGYAVVAMNYRYACGDFHKQMEDIENAIGLIRARSAEWNIDDATFALVGGSAGGHLSLLYGHAFDSQHVVKTVVSLVGPTDMTDTLFHQYADNYQIGYVFEAFFGTSYGQNPQLYEDGSPIFNYTNVPTFFLCGALDDLVPYGQSIRMFDTLTTNGIVADTTVFYNAGHDLFGPGQINKNQIYDELLLWLNTYLVN
ncbi:MAG: alpha/beta hydrolase [Flavobacteriales bacterium]|nr:alpha/beta hydrolase [Flavobacteriales bacterium]